MRPSKVLLATLSFTAAVAALPSEAAAQPRVGAGLVYGTEVEEAGIQINGYYGLNQVLEGLRVGAEFSYFFMPDPLTFWTLDLNGQYRFYGPEALGVYAIGGLDIARLSSEFGGIEVGATEIGLNIGAGVEYAVVPNVELFGELKYVISEADQAVFALGARYLFL